MESINLKFFSELLGLKLKLSETLYIFHKSQWMNPYKVFVPVCLSSCIHDTLTFTRSKDSNIVLFAVSVEQITNGDVIISNNLP